MAKSKNIVVFCKTCLDNLKSLKSVNSVVESFKESQAMISAKIDKIIDHSTDFTKEVTQIKNVILDKETTTINNKDLQYEMTVLKNELKTGWFDAVKKMVVFNLLNLKLKMLKKRISIRPDLTPDQCTELNKLLIEAKKKETKDKGVFYSEFEAKSISGE
ncbi:hypothetical protein HELRODRAFT_162880 [Helobdella robusta]|uniref:Uncharacterized protein n=1 Tax=Helobdella robusta TaxID=6412 RepID=T1ETB2_HELRO|nr:hypothetical protein HELRODRAFT_162880 [Helobdella robusta]ESN99349.1 hypothetical protein HELRODRAFT_162880 [Helobdella robusta]